MNSSSKAAPAPVDRTDAGGSPLALWGWLPGLGAALLLAFVLGDASGEVASWSSAGIRASLTLILVGGLFGALIGRPTRSALAIEVMAILVSAAFVAWCAGEANASSSAFGLATVVLVCLLAPWSVVLLPRLFGWIGLARAILLLVLGGLFGAPWLVPTNWSPVPSWALTFNPFVRIHGQLSPEDWTHGPLVYQRMAGRYYEYPQGSEGLVVALIVIGVALSTALVWVSWSRKLQRSGQGEGGDQPQSA